MIDVDIDGTYQEIMVTVCWTESVRTGDYISNRD